MFRSALSAATVLALSGCASMMPPSPEKLASLPVVEFPAPPPAGEFIFKLPKGKPIPTHVIVEGTALASGDEKTLVATLPNDLYLYGKWISQDGKTWRPAKDVIDVKVAISLPSNAYPKPGEIRVTVDKTGR